MTEDEINRAAAATKDDLLKEDAESERAGHRKGVLFKRDACGPSGRFFEPKRQAGLDLTRQERADGR